MELTAATLSVKLCKQIINELDYTFDEIVYWTDSMAVIRYIANESSSFLTFVANRVSVITDGSDTTQWRYVNSKDNPADAASRGLTMDNFLKASYWFHGPSFLWNAIEDDSEPENRSLDIDIDDVELKKPVHVTLLNSSQEQSPTDRFLSYFSDWHKLKKAVAFILIWKAHLRRKALKAEATLQNQSCDDDRKRQFLSVDDLVSAEVAIIRYLQSTYFRDELKSLEDGGAITRSSSVYKLDPILVDGLLRVGGRLDRSELAFDSKHQILVPKNTHVTNLILAEIHRMVGHMVKNSMLSMLRQQYWIPGAGSLIKGVISKCVICQRYKAKPGNQKMADLPSIRLTADEPPFTRTGVDYFGPFYVKRGRSDVKRYGVIFTCLAMRAVHLEVAQSMNTDSCINAIRRFLACRGPVKVIVSDNGSNLVGANRELRAEIKRWNNSKIHETLLQRNIDWQFNPPGGSHFGGVWERLIRSVRSVLLCVLKSQAIHLDDESLCTLFCEVEDVLNSRPITEVQSEPNDLSPLTPNHLLKIRSCQPLPPGIFQRDDSYVKRKWRQIQYLADLFWRRWSKEYLSSLQERQKWNRPKQNLRIGDLVILVDNPPRNSLPLGRVTELFKDKKGYVRTVKVRTQLTELVRPIDKLCVVMENQP